MLVDNSKKSIANISVIGIGSAGNKTIEFMPKNEFSHVKFLYANDSINELSKYDKNSTILLENNNNKSQEANDPVFGKIAATNSWERIKEKLSNTEVLILTAGFGGVIGTGALPLISKLARDMGIITIAIVTTPFSSEGSKKDQIAKDGIEELKKNVDSYIVVSKNRLINNYPDIAATDVYKLVDSILKNCIKTFIDILYNKSSFNISISDFELIIKNKGEMYIGFGNGIGKNKISRAIDAALNSKIIENTYKNASNAILNIVGDPTVTMNEINKIIDSIKHKTPPFLNVAYTFSVNNKLRNEIWLSLVATSNIDNKIILTDEQDKKLYESQEFLLKIGNTLENELNGFVVTEKSDSIFDKDSFNEIKSDDKGQNEYISTSEISEEDDDIPFFLK